MTERIKDVVSSEFDRVETRIWEIGFQQSFGAVAETQDGAKRERTDAISKFLKRSGMR